MPRIESERWVRRGACALRIRYTDDVEAEVSHGVLGALVVGDAPVTATSCCPRSALRRWRIRATSPAGKTGRSGTWTPRAGASAR
ncbi:MAG: hypothetical protein AAF447_10055 [Myxococcota bacterium]